MVTVVSGPLMVKLNETVVSSSVDEVMLALLMNALAIKS
jgi:hypothetical protein